MGSFCTKFEDNGECLDLVSRRNKTIDEMVIPEPECIRLQYLNDFQDKFNILKYIQLVDFINLLNTFRFDEPEETSSHSVKFTDSLLNKDGWIKFINYRILESPIIPNIDSVGMNLQKQFFDDVFDRLLMSYRFFFQTENYYIPKIMVISFAFNYCGRKISQNVDIFLNLFCNPEGKIEFTNDVYAFLYCLITFAFDFPTEFLTKFTSPEYNKNYFNVKSSSEWELFSKVDERDSICKQFFQLETRKIFGEDEKKSYTRDEFKLLLLDTSENGGTWIIDNGLLRTRMEAGLQA